MRDEHRIVEAARWASSLLLAVLVFSIVMYYVVLCIPVFRILNGYGLWVMVFWR